MREIRYRVYNKGTGTMHYPDLDEVAERAKLCEMVLMQYIGIKDSRGNRIYEGDLVRITTKKSTHSVLETSPRIVEIRWDDDFACFGLWGIRTDDVGRKCGLVSIWYEFGKTPSPKITKVGNIYQNPVLLEK